jgi:hypothetical protein
LSKVIIFGGYGTFGSIIARELARLGIQTIISGRDLNKAEELARELGPSHRALAANVSDIDSCIAALKEAGSRSIAVNCTGPFSILGRAILDACLQTVCDYADISDDRAYATLVRSYSERFKESGLTAVYGCSSLPAISGALGLTAAEGVETAPRHVRVTLFIGNNNPKGIAAIRSAVGMLGKEIRAPQGIIKGFRDGETIMLPEPLGSHRFYNFESPEFDLFPELFSAESVAVKVGFELKSATRTFALLAALSSNYGDRVALFLERVGRFSRGIGISGGAVMTELFYADGSVRRAALFSKENAQRMASLPCVFAVQQLYNSNSSIVGTVTAYELLGANVLIDRIVAEGFQFLRETTKTQRHKEML